MPGILRAQSQLPEGDAKEGVQAMCVQCHQIGRVTGMHLSRAEWKNTVEDMVRMGAEVPPDWVDPIVDYLALNFPDKSEPAGSPAHVIDVSMEVVRRPAQATPQEIVADKNGDIWSTAQGSNRIVSVHRDSMTPREFVLPNVEARPRSVAVGDDNLIWYADDRGYIGRLDPATHTVREWAWPGGRESPPGGIAILRGGVWSTECKAGACSLVRLDSNTSTFRTWTMPEAVASVTRLVATADDQLAATAGGSSAIVVISVK